MNETGPLCLAVIMAALFLLTACKSDDAFVVGGGPKPGTGVQPADHGEGNRSDSVSAGTDNPINAGGGTESGVINETTSLADDLAGPILYTTGDTLLLVGDAVNGLGSTLPQPLNDTTVLIGNTIHSMEHTVDTALVAGLIDSTHDDSTAGLVGGLLNTVDNTLGSVTADGSLLGGIENSVDSLIGGNSSSTGNDQLLGSLTDGVTGTVNNTSNIANDLTGSLTSGDDLLGGVTNTVDGVVEGVTGVDTNGSGAGLSGNRDGLLGTGLLAR